MLQRVKKTLIMGGILDIKCFSVEHFVALFFLLYHISRIVYDTLYSLSGCCGVN